MKILVIIIFFCFLSERFVFADNKKIKVFKEQFEQGLISENEYNAAKKIFENKNLTKNNNPKKTLKLIKKKEKLNIRKFLKKGDEPIFDDDLALLEIYDKNKFDEEFKKYPKELIQFFGNNSNVVNRTKKAGTFMSKEFNRSQKFQAKYPGKMIKAMAMYEIFYIGKLRETKSALLRYREKKNTKYLRKIDDKKKIRSIIALNNGRKKMREALGMTLNTPRIEAAKKFWYLGDFLEMGTAVKNENYDENLEKRKKLLNDYKQKISHQDLMLEYLLMYVNVYEILYLLFFLIILQNYFVLKLILIHLKISLLYYLMYLYILYLFLL